MTGVVRWGLFVDWQMEGAFGVMVFSISFFHLLYLYHDMGRVFLRQKGGDGI